MGTGVSFAVTRMEILMKLARMTVAQTTRALAVSGLVLNMLGAVLLLWLAPGVVTTRAIGGVTLFIVWHRSMAVYASIAALFIGFLLQLIAASRR